MMTVNQAALTDEEKEKKWLGRSNATAKAISDTEKRLGLQLPEDYKAFLGSFKWLLWFLYL